MKGIRTSIVCCALAGATLTSCIGSYALFNKVRGWNEQATGNKFLNELIHIGLWIVPVYEVTFLADILVLNSVEFWSGTNPIAAGTVKEVNTENGELWMDDIFMKEAPTDIQRRALDYAKRALGAAVPAAINKYSDLVANLTKYVDGK